MHVLHESHGTLCLRTACSMLFAICCTMLQQYVLTAHPAYKIFADGMCSHVAEQYLHGARNTHAHVSEWHARDTPGLPMLDIVQALHEHVILCRACHMPSGCSTACPLPPHSCRQLWCTKALCACSPATENGFCMNLQLPSFDKPYCGPAHGRALISLTTCHWQGTPYQL